MPLTDFILPLLLASSLLSIERISYVLIWRKPREFARWAARTRIAGGPVRALERLFCVFKFLQLLVFSSWIFAFSDSSVPFPTGSIVSQSVAAGLILAGQLLNFSTFWQLGRKGIFYGARFGHDIPWRTGFPFSVCPHPQYLGTVMSIWGVFLLFRYPGTDWYLIPFVETVFYMLGAYLEKSDPNQTTNIGDHSLDRIKEIVES